MNNKLVFEWVFYDENGVKFYMDLRKGNCIYHVWNEWDHCSTVDFKTAVKCFTDWLGAVSDTKSQTT